MKINKNKSVSFVLLLGICTLLFFPTPARANIFDDIVTGVRNRVEKGVNEAKNLFSKKELKVDSGISLVPGGDLNKNGQVDAGDSVKFSYTITNSTKNLYRFAKLQTNINAKEINSITNVRGALSLDANRDTITIPNLSIESGQVRKISFDAWINFYKDTDQSISTEAELLDDKDSLVFKAQKKEVSAKKMEIEQFNKYVHITK